ncbi:MAG: hypothetical protein ABJD97_13950, partial [Betaproteobacteria bacterium]
MSSGWVAQVRAGLLAPLRVSHVALVLLLAFGLAAWVALGTPANGVDAPAPSAAAGDWPVFTIRQADFCRRPGLGDDIPDARCPWETVPLAKTWRGPDAAGVHDGWYRLHFRLGTVPEQGLAMVVVAFNRTGRLFVNGQYLRQVGPMAEPLPLNWNRPEYALLPPGVLRVGDNEIEIQQRIYGWEQGWLAPVQLGPEKQMLSMWRLRVFWQNELVRIMGVSTAAIGLFMLGVWLGRRSHAMYFWFGWVSLLWTAISLHYFALFPPLPAHVWERCMEAAEVLRAVLMFMFTLRYMGKRWPLIEASAWAYLILGSAAMFGEVLPSDAVDLWHLGALLGSVVYCVMLVREGLRHGVLEGALLAIAGAVQIGLGGYDLWLLSADTWTDRVHLAHFSAPLFVGVVATLLIQRFVESLGAYEKLAAVLEQRVGEKASELERNYERLLEARRNQALAVERSRIMSEMHDGIGSQLTLALSLVRRMDHEADPSSRGEDGQVATVLRESIEDLQLIIDSLEPVENDLLTVLGTLRYRLQDRLGKGGIELQWNVVDLPPMPMLTPHSVLSILRIVQEAFANCLKHSGAT